MAKQKPLESRWPAILDITLVPAVARLPSAAPTERRDGDARDALLRRIHGEFQDMPGLSLTLPQAARLFDLRSDIATRILNRLSDERVLRQRRDGQFALRVQEP
jgi:hypothetical protein